MQDDLESLGYAFLEMLTGDLLWDLVANVPYGDGDYFSQEQLISMADTRDQLWEEACRKGEVPTFLINWQRYVRGLKVSRVYNLLSLPSCNISNINCNCAGIRHTLLCMAPSPDSALTRQASGSVFDKAAKRLCCRGRNHNSQSKESESGTVCCV